MRSPTGNYLMDREQVAIWRNRSLSPLSSGRSVHAADPTPTGGPIAMPVGNSTKPGTPRCENRRSRAVWVFRYRHSGLLLCVSP